VCVVGGSVAQPRPLVPAFVPWITQIRGPESEGTQGLRQETLRSQGSCVETKERAR
jgi:hypothetical protein